MVEPELSFAGLLRQLRAEAKLTQEELAEAASLSPQAVAALERGVHRTAHKDTAVLLAGALGLPGQVRILFVAAARGKGPAADVLTARQGVAPGAFAAAATQALPRDIAAFTGHQAELAVLLEAIDGLAASGGVVGIHAIDGMAGIGKTTFAVHAAHRLAEHFPDGQFFLPLHAHTPGQRPVDPADALASLLLTAGVAAAQIPPGLQARAGRWRDHVAGRKILLLLDDAAGHEQVRPLLPGTAGSLVLVTSRRRLTALEDAAAVSLDILPADEAAALLVRLAARPELRAGDAAVGEVTRLCGYLPLAIGMLASQLRYHPTRSGGDLAAELAQARDRLALMHAEDLSVAAAFGLSYNDLTAGTQRLFRHIGLVPGPSIDAYAAAALDGTSLATARHHLDELYDQHLLTEPAPGRYQLHDLLREHAQALAVNDDPADRDAATGRLLDYYLHTALAASQRITIQMTPIPPLPAGRQPGYVPKLSTPGQAAAWLETERANLHAATGYAAACGRFQHAIAIPAVMADFLDARGHWDQAADLHQTALTAARQAGDRAGQAGALTNLCSMQGSTGDYRSAATSVTRALALYRDLGDRAGQANALNNLGIVQRLTGDHQAATASCQQALELFCDLGHRYGQGDALLQLGAAQTHTGDYTAAAECLQQALALYRDVGHRLGQADALGYLGHFQIRTGDYTAAAESLQQALALYRNVGHRLGQGDALSHLGIVQRLTGDYPAAAASYQQALEQFRDLGDRIGQAHAHHELGLLHQLTGDYPAAAASHQQALDVFRDRGDRLSEAETLNGLGELLSRSSASQQARDHHTQALAIARDLGVLQEEARALEGIGRCHIQDGNPGEGAAKLQQALAIYQRIGAPAARRVQQTLQNHKLASPTPECQPAAPQTATAITYARHAPGRR